MPITSTAAPTTIGPNGRGQRHVSLIAEGEDDHHQQRRADDLVDEPAGEIAQVILGIRRPDAGGGQRAGRAFEVVDRFVIGEVHHGRSGERAGHLRQAVGRHFAPGKSAVHGQRQA